MDKTTFHYLTFLSVSVMAPCNEILDMKEQVWSKGIIYVLVLNRGGRC